MSPCPGRIQGAAVALCMGPYRDAYHPALIHNSLNLLQRIVLVQLLVPAPDAAACGPDFNCIRILAESSSNCLAQIPWSVHTLSPWMGFVVIVAGKLVGIPVSAGTAESKSGCHYPGALHDAGFHHVADLDAGTGNLTNRGKAVLQTLMGLLYRHHCLLYHILQYPVAVIVCQVS